MYRCEIWQLSFERRTWGGGGSLITTSLLVFCWVCWWKSSENRSMFGKVKGKSRVSSILNNEERQNTLSDIEHLWSSSQARLSIYSIGIVILRGAVHKNTVEWIPRSDNSCMAKCCWVAELSAEYEEKAWCRRTWKELQWWTWQTKKLYGV